jgi:Glycosyl transferase family 2
MRREPPGTVAVVDNGTWEAEMGIALAALMLPPGSSVVRVEGTHVGMSRNKAVDIMQGEWLCFIDSDHGFPPDAVMRLLAWGESAVTALNVDRAFPFPPIAFLDQPRPTRRLRPGELPADGLHPVGTFGCGMTLIRRGCLDDVRALLDRDYEESRKHLETTTAIVHAAQGTNGFGQLDGTLKYLEQLLSDLRPMPLFAMGQIDPERTGEDTWFGFHARRAGHQLYVDASLRPSHKFSGMATCEPEAAILQLPTLGAGGLAQLRLAYNMEMPKEAVEKPVEDPDDPERILVDSDYEETGQEAQDQAGRPAGD